MMTLGKTLLLRKDINLIQLNLALDFRVFYGGKLGTNLLELGIISEDTLSQALAQSLGIPPALKADLENVAPDVLATIPPEVAYRSQAVPFRIMGPQLYVAFAEPRNSAALAQVRRVTKLQILPHISCEFRIQTALENFYQIRMDPRMKEIEAKALSTTPFYPADSSTQKEQDWHGDHPPKVVKTRFSSSASPSGKVTLSVQKITLMLEEAKSRDAIGQLVLQFAQKYLERVALFVLRKDVGFGWDAIGEGLSKEMIKAIVFPIKEPSIFNTVVASQGHYLGRVPDTAVNEQFYKAFGEPKPHNVLLLPLTLGGITFGALYGDNGTKQVQSDGINELQVVVSRANIAFERLIIAEREKALRAHAAV
jgi:hypothetical protein